MSDTLEAMDNAFVEIALGGKTQVLRPSLGAAIAINRALGGYVTALQKLSNLDLDAIVFVIREGLGLTEKKAQARSLDAQVWQAGLAEAATAAIRYVRVLMNGGKSVDDAPETDDAADDAGNDEAAPSE